MKRIAASVTVALPADLCCRMAERSYADPRWQAAYTSLRPARTYSGRVTAREAGRRLEITVSAVDALTGAQMPPLGYRVVYHFAEAAGRTKVEVAVEYEMLAAMGGMGTLQGQATNEILHRLAAMVTLEAGYEAAVGATTVPLS